MSSAPGAAWLALAFVATALLIFAEFPNTMFARDLAIRQLQFIVGSVEWLLIAAFTALPPSQVQRKVSPKIIFRTVIVVTLVSITIGWDSCPHARYLFIGPDLIRFTLSGTPCANIRHVSTIWHLLLGIPGFSA